MRTALEYGPYLELRSVVPITNDSTGRAFYNYDVPRRHQPVTKYPVGYFFSNATLNCSSPGDPWQPQACQTETDAAQKRAQQIAAANSCTLTSYNLQGAYTDPYARIGGGTTAATFKQGYINNGSRKLNVIMQCGSEQRTSADNLIKQQSFTCPAGFEVTKTTTPDSSIVPWDLCKVSALTDPYFTGPLQQVCTTRGTPRPCYPATGDKAREETDFTFAGRPFVRYYHSLGQYRGHSSLGSAWAHTYTERMGGYGDKPYRFSSQGHFEYFSPVGGSNTRYRAQNSSDRILDTIASGDVRYRLTDTNGEIREFNDTGRLLRIRDPDNPDSDVELVYDSTTGLLSKIVDVYGRALTFGYTSNGRLSNIALPNGSNVSYEYDLDANLTAADYGNGQRKVYHYHENGLADPSFNNLLTGITDETNQRYASFGYDAYGRVTSSRLHANGGYVNQSTLSYNTADKATVTSENGDTETFTMEPGLYRHILDVKDSAGNDTKTYDSAGRLDTQTDARGNLAKYAYTDTTTVSYLSSLTEAVGTAQERKTTFTRNNDNRLTRREVYGLQNGVQTLKRIELFVYDPITGRRTVMCEVDPTIADASSYTCGSQTNAPTGVRQTRTTYCEQADVTAGTCPLIGQIIKVDGPRTDVSDLTTYTYYPSDDATCTTAPTTCPHRKGDLWKVTNALSHVVETLKYDGAGRLLSVKDVNGVITDYEYSPRGWLTARKLRGTDNAVETDDQITRIDYHANGLVKKITDPTTASVTFTYDTAQRLVSLTDDDDNKVSYELDNAGNRTKEQVLTKAGAEIRLLTRTFNTLGQLATQSDADTTPNKTSFTYDANGNPETTTDPLTHRTRQGYDALDRLASTLEDETGLQVETKYEYDALDNLTKVTDPRKLDTTYTYNAFGEVTQEVSKDRGTTNYTYDNAGNLKTRTDARVPSVTATYEYDALNRVTKITAGSEVQTFAYDTCTFGKGRLCATTAVNANTQFTYARDGQIATRRELMTVGGVQANYPITYTYDAAGRVTTIQYVNGVKVGYGYNRDKPTSMTVQIGTATPVTVISSATYDPFGPVTGWTYGNGLKRVVGYNKDGQVNAISTNDSGPLQSLTYGYDNNNRIGKVTDGVEALFTKTYGYDALSRLTSSDNPLADQDYAYDATGNRISDLNGGWGTTTYAYDAPASSNRVNSTTNAAFGTTAVGYDPTGNMTSNNNGTIGNFVFAYGGFNRLKSVTKNGVMVGAYDYNVFGQRVTKTTGTLLTRYVYDGDSRLIAEHLDNGDVWTNYLWFAGELVGLIRGGNVYYIHTDHLGRPELATDNTKAVVWKSINEAFGDRNVTKDDIGGLNVGLPGQYYDQESYLWYNIYRYYNASSGRYTQADPIGLSGGINPYAYALNSPLAYTDAFGLEPDGLLKERFPERWSRDRCANIWSRVLALRRDIDKRYIELDADILTLPNTGPGPNAATRMGHIREINRLDSIARSLEDDWDRHCGNGPPGSPATETCPAEQNQALLNAPVVSEQNQTSPGAKVLLYIGGFIFAVLAFSP